MQLQLVDFVVDRLGDGRAPAPQLSLDELRRAGLATGLTALTAALASDDFAPSLRPHLDEQRQQVAQRVARFHPVIARTLAALDTAGVAATPVKGAELVNGIWPEALPRPMADVDVIVPAELRSQAGAAMAAAGLAFAESSALEDTFLAWGDGRVGRTDGESVDHNGRVELHPGWSEFVHGYTVAGFPLKDHTASGQLLGSSCSRLDLHALTAHVIGHLSSTVVRCEVRAVNVVDVWFCMRAGAEWVAVEALLDECDPRLSGPGLWMASRLLPGVVPASTLARQLARLPQAGQRRLAAIAPAAVLRDPSSRTTLGWRQAFTTTAAERTAVVRQMARSKRVRR